MWDEVATLPSDCSGNPKSCPDNEGCGCVCSLQRAAMACKRSHPHDAMDYDCRLMTLVERAAAKWRQSETGAEHG
jgi:hypothetical protein